MVFSDTTNYTGIIQECERLTGLGYGAISGATAKLKEFTSLANIESNKIWHTIFTSNGNWQYDDSNKTDLPFGATDIVSGTSAYALPSEALTIKRIELKDSNGDWFRLSPITLEEVDTIGEFQTDAGTPKFYRLVNGTAVVYPTPNYNSTGGFKVSFDRASVDFATTDTTKTPGFASPYHSILPTGMTIAWLKTKINSQFAVQQINILTQDYLKLEKNLKEFYGKRFKDKIPMVGRAYQSYK